MATEQANFRLDKDTADRFRKFCKENGMNQSQGFEHLMQILELDRAKKVFPGSEKDLEIFEMHVKKIVEAYINRVEEYNNARELAHEHYSSLLVSKDKTIEDLQQKSSGLLEAKTTAEQTAAAAAKAAAQASKEAQAVKDQAETALKLIEEKERTIATLTDKLTAAEARASKYDELASALSAANEQLKELDHRLSNSKKDAELEREKALREAELQNARLQMKIEMLEAQLAAQSK